MSDFPANKNQAKAEPLSMAEIYARFFDGKETRIVIPYQEGGAGTFEFVRRMDDPASSFSAALMVNRADGHAVLFYKGTDLPGRDEGASRTGFIGDFKAIRQAQKGLPNPQTAPAEKAYLTAIDDQRIASLEIVGYSIGSQHLNYMAAKYGAKGTTIADMGLSNAVLRTIREGRLAALPAISDAELAQNVTVLHLSADILPSSFAAGPVRGHVVALDEGIRTHLSRTGARFSAAAAEPTIKGKLKGAFAAVAPLGDEVMELSAIAHIPQIYAANSARLAKRR